ncbi:hypothetical protein [Cellulomonas sp. KRMCY2]|uniref:hypothetical protein n=1 Tax=Cellulomonas sp. KRMCY2 TaxID=1304865 RepID=UPI00045EB2BE|nr:hypothetical protein [Cellulomonas sp. KRMCY2]
MSAAALDTLSLHGVGWSLEHVAEHGLAEHGLAAGWTATTAADPDEPTLREGVDPEDVSPGVLGFLVIFAVVLACIPLFRSMTSKLRGVEHRARREASTDDLPTNDLPTNDLPTDALPGSHDAPGA